MFLVLGLATITFFVGSLIINANKYIYLLAACRRLQSDDDSPVEDKVCIIPGKTIFGNNCDFLKMTTNSITELNRFNCEYAGGRSYAMYFVGTPVYNVTNADDAAAVFQNKSLIVKGRLYNLLRPFLGDGLLTSSGRKWQAHRKILTPAFHFEILQTSFDVFKEESYNLIKRLHQAQDQHHALILEKFIPQFTLNNICETALGVKLDNTEGGDCYRQAIHNLESVIFKRWTNLPLMSDLLFYLFGDYNEQKINLKIINDFCDDIIQKRRLDFSKQSQFDWKQKKRYALLDTLLDAESSGMITRQDIYDEVNTFVFEGYDTTAAAIMFALWNMAYYPSVQQKCFDELQNLPPYEDLKLLHLNRLQYLEQVIKESLRLYPSVPAIIRACNQDTAINGLILPKGTQINLHIFDIMRDPKYFDEPHQFRPERFSPDNARQRHPFAHVPFSAGSRNCIGQKFAMIELKVTLMAVIREFKLLPVIDFKDMTFQDGIVLRPKPKLCIKLVKRQNESRNK